MIWDKMLICADTRKFIRNKNHRTELSNTCIIVYIYIHDPYIRGTHDAIIIHLYLIFPCTISQKISQPEIKKKTLLNLSRKYILSNKISGFNLFPFVDRKHVLLLKSTLISKRKQPRHSKKFSASYSSANEIYFNHDLNKNKNLKIFYTRNSS